VHALNKSVDELEGFCTMKQLFYSGWTDADPSYETILQFDKE